MHIPPYHKKPTWRLFFVGVFFGSIIGYLVIIYMYGSMYEDLLKENIELTSEVNELKKQNNALLEDKEERDEESQQPLTVSSIEIIFQEPERLKMDLLIQDQLKALIRQEIDHLIGEELATLSKADQLLYSTIEHKGFELEDLTYRFSVKKIVIDSELEIVLYPESVQ
ncbi:sporulation membrane protein YtrI [Oceanobacillus iheyensis]|uniref:Hypothetical conserved protein n=1 Tax=Oceanobacillus iheyensis (strain DSM 14371 / CIP 107618 / JCM 11309 / KCTC 3954 / HTE831) TaxID=221109 RepID=Q8EPD1_OCEIH|nr:sporulation membrane protein YtrI [Oceanobacillus iheyensis]BAC14135.1 hypothetical conserved protein [Oceanobacillus iheyensis HTE831]